MYCCSLCVAVGNQIYKNSRKGRNSETPSNISICSWATAPKRPESGSHPCLTLQHDKMASEEHSQWPKCKEREVWIPKSLRNRTTVSVYIKGTWNLKRQNVSGRKHPDPSRAQYNTFIFIYFFSLWHHAVWRTLTGSVACFWYMQPHNIMNPREWVIAWSNSVGKLCSCSSQQVKLGSVAPHGAPILPLGHTLQPHVTYSAHWRSCSGGESVWEISARSCWHHIAPYLCLSSTPLQVISFPIYSFYFPYPFFVCPPVAIFLFLFAIFWLFDLHWVWSFMHALSDLLV